MDPEKQNSTPTVGNTKSKKWLYIIGGIIVVLVLAHVAVGGFTRSMTGAYMMHNGYDGSTTYSNGQGTVTVDAQKMPDNWPSDAPTYANAQIETAVASNPQTGQAGSSVVFTTSDSAQTVTDFYKTQLAADGWKVEQTMTSTSGTVIAATKDTRTFGIYIVDSGDGKTSVTASVSQSGDNNGRTSCATNSDCPSGESCEVSGPIVQGQGTTKVCVPNGQASPQ